MTAVLGTRPVESPRAGAQHTEHVLCAVRTPLPVRKRTQASKQATHPQEREEDDHLAGNDHEAADLGSAFRLEDPMIRIGNSAWTHSIHSFARSLSLSLAWTSLLSLPLPEPLLLQYGTYWSSPQLRNCSTFVPTNLASGSMPENCCHCANERFVPSRKRARSVRSKSSAVTGSPSA